MASRILPGFADIKAGWSNGEDGWGADVNNNFLKLSICTQITAINVVESLPPVVADGEIYLILATALENGGTVAARDDGMWRYIYPKEGWTAYVSTLAVPYRFKGGNWVAELTSANLPSYGVGQSNYMLAVNPLGTGVIWVPPPASPYEIPLFDSAGADNGKILSIGPGAEPEDDSRLLWVEAPISLPVIPAGSAGKVAVVNPASNGVTYEDDAKYTPVAPGHVLTDADFSGRVVLGASGDVNIPMGITRGSTVTIFRSSANEVEILAAPGVTLNVADGRASLRSRYSAIVLTRTGANTYVMFGDVTQGA